MNKISKVITSVIGVAAGGLLLFGAAKKDAEKELDRQIKIKLKENPINFGEKEHTNHDA